MTDEREQIIEFLGRLSTRARHDEVRVALAYAMAAVIRGDYKPGSTIQPPGDLFRPLSSIMATGQYHGGREEK